MSSHINSDFVICRDGDRIVSKDLYMEKNSGSDLLTFEQHQLEAGQLTWLDLPSKLKLHSECKFVLTF